MAAKAELEERMEAVRPGDYQLQVGLTRSRDVAFWRVCFGERQGGRASGCRVPSMFSIEWYSDSDHREQKEPGIR